MLLVDPWRDKEETIEDVVEMPVMDIIADDAIMFMWTTVEQLPESMALLETWGFDYRSQLVWRKSKATITAYTREQHELVLIGKRGNPAKPAERERPPSVFEAPVPRQGRHPDILFQIVERCCRRPSASWCCRPATCREPIRIRGTCGTRSRRASGGWHDGDRHFGDQGAAGTS